MQPTPLVSISARQTKSLSCEEIQLLKPEKWPNGYISFQYLAIYNVKKLPKHQKMPKEVQIFVKTLNKPSTICQRFLQFCQSGEILPNLVTLQAD